MIGLVLALPVVDDWANVWAGLAGALVGALAMAGLPPLNGFVSEWLLLQAFLFTPTLPQSFVNMLVPLAAAAVTTVSAIAAPVQRQAWMNR